MEIKIIGSAVEETRVSVHEHYAAAVVGQIGWQPVVGRFALFRVVINEVTFVGYDPQTHAQHVARWPDGVEYVRAATTPTSLGPRKAVRQILEPI